MQKDVLTKEYLTLKEVAEETGLSYGTIKRDIDRGKLPAYRIGRKYFIGYAIMEAYRKDRRPFKNVEGYTIQDLMGKIPLSYAFLIEMIKEKKLEAVKVGRQYIIPYATFDAFMENRKVESF